MEFHVNIGPSHSKACCETNITPISYLNEVNQSMYLYDVAESDIINIIKNLKNSSMALMVYKQIF